MEKTNNDTQNIKLPEGFELIDNKNLVNYSQGNGKGCLPQECKEETSIKLKWNIKKL